MELQLFIRRVLLNLFLSKGLKLETVKLHKSFFFISETKNSKLYFVSDAVKVAVSVTYKEKNKKLHKKSKSGGTNRC